MTLINPLCRAVNFLEHFVFPFQWAFLPVCQRTAPFDNEHAEAQARSEFGGGCAWRCLLLPRGLTSPSLCVGSAALQHPHRPGDVLEVALQALPLPPQNLHFLAPVLLFPEYFSLNEVLIFVKIIGWVCLLYLF